MGWNSCVAALLCVALTSGVRAQEPEDARKGLRFAQEACSACHGVLVTDRVSPRPGIATFNVIANTPGMTGTALSVWLQTSHRSMPNLIIEREDRNNVIAYIVSLRGERSPL